MILVDVLIFMIISGLLGFSIGIINKYVYVKKDEKVEEVYKMLPGYNCGSCGKAGCYDFAKSLVMKELTVDLCKPCKASQKEEIRKYIND